MMYQIEDMLEDNLDDSITRIAKKLNERTSWTNKSKELLGELINELEKQKYIEFRGHPTRYHLFRVGQSCLFDVPGDRKGHLKKFRGKRIRIICVGSGQFDRLLMAGLVPDDS